MANITVKFIHPTDMSEAEAELDESTTAEIVINELITQNFLANNPYGGYRLYIKGGAEIYGNQTLASGSATTGSEIRIRYRTAIG